MTVAPRPTLRILFLAAALLAASACEKPKPEPKAPGPSPADYIAPPELTAAQRGPGGVVRLSGTGAPHARIRLASPAGTATGTTVGVDGRWSVDLVGAPEVRLISLSQDFDGRLVRARGYLAVLPQPGAAAATIRPGAGARPVLTGASPLPLIGSVEFDAAGAGVVAGRARPHEAVRVFLDGQEAGEGMADAAGWYDLSLSETLVASGHSVIVTTPSGRAAQAFDGTRAAPIATPPFAASRKTGAWRLDWMTPGGGVQTTMLFDPPTAGS